MNEVGFGRATYPSGRVCRHSGHYIRKTLLEINKMLAVISGVLRRCSRPRHSRPAGHPRLAVTLAAPRRHSRACSGIQFFSLGSWLLALGSYGAPAPSFSPKPVVPPSAGMTGVTGIQRNKGNRLGHVHNKRVRRSAPSFSPKPVVPPSAVRLGSGGGGNPVFFAVIPGLAL